MSTTGNLRAHGDRTEAILAAVHKRIGTQKFNAWFKNCTCLTLENGCIKVGAASPFVAGWIESHFAGDLAFAAQEVTGRKLQLMVGVDPVLSGRLRKRQLDVQARLVARHTAGTTRRQPAPTASLRYKLEDFVVGPSNRLAHSAAMAVAGSGKASFNPLFIHGSCGVGKTHLVQGICNAVASLGRGKQNCAWKYTTAEQFTNDFVTALRKKRLEDFRRTYRRLDLLAIDDVHFLAAKKATQEEFLHTFNTIESAGKQVVMASDAHPRMVGQLTERLVSRFLSGMVVKIDPPGLDTRIKILGRFIAGTKLEVGKEVLEYIAQQIRGSVRELEGALIKLGALAGLSDQPISVQLARDAMADHLALTDSALTLGDIETAVAAFFGITPADLHSTRRTHTVSLARAIAMFLGRRHTRMSFPEIGRFMGKNHSSVVLAVQRMEKLLNQNADCRWMTPVGHKSMPTKALLNVLSEQMQ